MGRRGTTSGKVGAYKEIFGSFDALRTYTGISSQRLRAISEGAQTTAGERSRIAAFGRRLDDGVVSYSLQEAARKRDVSLNQIGRELQDVARGAFIPKERMDLGTLSYKLGVDPNQLYRRSMEPIVGRWGKEIRDPRGITEAYLDDKGRVVGYGRDGNVYVGYTVTNKQTKEKRFYWGRFQSLGYMSAAAVADMYDMDGYDFAIDLADVDM
jgi:hypothetical protein